MEQFPRIVAIDYGKKRVGVAVSDPLRLFAQNYGTWTPQEVLDRIRQLRDLHGISRFIVGWPLMEDGSEGEAVRFVQSFAARLQRAFPDVPIIRWDERYTSEMAKDVIRSLSLPKKARRDKGRVDATAASIMLQEYLDTSRSTEV